MLSFGQLTLEDFQLEICTQQSPNVYFRNDQQSYNKWTEYLDTYGNSDQSIFPDYQPTTMTFTTENLEKVELYRYWGSIGLFSLYVLLILLSFVAICCRSKV